MAVGVTSHRFRHTLGTRLINSDVPQHVVQKLLGDASPEMTAHYAHIHYDTVRDAFDRYQQQRSTPPTGEFLAFDPDGPTASAEWVKHNLARVRAASPTVTAGGRRNKNAPIPTPVSPARISRPRLSSSDVHRQQAGAPNRLLIARADAGGQFRLAANLRQVQTSLERIIPALEALGKDGPGDDSR